MEAGKAPKIKSGRAIKNTTPPKEVFVNKRGSAIIAKALIGKMGFAEGDKFSVRKTKAGVSLKKI